MGMRGKLFSCLTVLALLFGVVLVGCTSNSDKKTAETNTPGTSSAPASASAKPPATEITMFMGDSGVPHTDGVDLSNNPFINIIEKYANVDLKMDIPQINDFKTKQDLLLASGKLPDIAHSWYLEDMEKAAKQGAFIDLKKYYDKSPAIQKIISPELMELSKSSDGHYYRIPMAWDKIDQGWWLQVKSSMIEKYNGGKWPTTVEDWVALLVKIHKADPNLIVMGSRVLNERILTYGGAIIYNMYGAEPYKYRVQNGKVVSTFTLPEFREATLVMKKLYDEGVLDKEFATKPSDDFVEKWYNKGILMQWNSGDRVVHNAKDEALGIESPNPDSKNWKLMFAPPLTQFKTNEKYIWPYKSYPITTHGIYISSSSKHPEEAFKVIEGFTTDELIQTMYWGKEGETFTVKDGKKTPDVKKLSDPKQTWSKMLYIVTGNRDADLVKAEIEMSTSPEYTKALYDSAKGVADMAEKKGYALFDFFHGASDNALKKTPEMYQYISQATVEAIMGKITIDEFDKRVKDFNGKYGFIYDELTKFMNDNKAALKKQGVNEVDW